MPPKSICRSDSTGGRSATEEPLIILVHNDRFAGLYLLDVRPPQLQLGLKSVCQWGTLHNILNYLTLAH